MSMLLIRKIEKLSKRFKGHAARKKDILMAVIRGGSR